MPDLEQLSLCVSCGYTGASVQMRRSDFMDSHSRHLRPMPRRRASLASASPEAALRDNLFFCDGEGEAHLPLLTAGVDEAGRGPLAGPVCAAAVILDPENPIEGLADSKKLSAKKREALAPIIRERALAWGIGWATVEEIDRVNILNATYLAMERAVAALKSRSGSVTPEYILIDGNRRPPHLPCMSDTIVKGDDKVPAISAASILAKTARDHRMAQLDQKWPAYGFAKHAGYGTAQHLDALKRLGPCPEHRTTFEPIKSMLSEKKTRHPFDAAANPLSQA